MKTQHIVQTRYFTYPEYRNLVLALAENNGTTGPDQTAERIDATKINAQRIKRLEKTVTISEQLSELVKSVNKKWKWVVLVESWCGDGAQNIPVIDKIVALNPDIDLVLLLRDENPEIMDKHLTNGSRSIPILICTDVQTGKEIGTWGPRPKYIAEMVKNYKTENPTVSHDEFVKNLHLWYAKDKGESIQKDFLLLVQSWKEKSIRD